MKIAILLIVSSVLVACAASPVPGVLSDTAWAFEAHTMDYASLGNHYDPGVTFVEGHQKGLPYEARWRVRWGVLARAAAVNADDPWLTRASQLCLFAMVSTSAEYDTKEKLQFLKEQGLPIKLDLEATKDLLVIDRVLRAKEDGR